MKFSHWRRGASRCVDWADSEARLLLGWTVKCPATPAQALEQWLAAIGTLPPVRGRILITALRNQTWIEWSAYCACVARQAGYESTLVCDGELMGALYPTRGFGRNFYSGLKRIPGIELVDLNALGEAIAPSSRILAEAEEWAPVALAYDFHLEEHDIRSQKANYRPAWRQYVVRASRLANGLNHYLQGKRFHRALCYSGLISESKLLLGVLREHEIKTVCLEGWAWRPGHMIYNLNAPALEYNVAGWMRSLGEWDEKKEHEVNAYLRFLDGKVQDSAWLNNFYRIQRDELSASLPVPLRNFVDGDSPIFLLAPNVIGDSSTLRRETIFPSMQVWTEKVIHWFGVRPHLKLVVRAHPAERWIGGKCAIYIGDVARKAAAGMANVHVIDSAESVNTFSLIPFARAGLAWLSSVGVDFVVRGLPTVVAARPKYSGLGIVSEPESVAAYFALLEKWALQGSRPDSCQIKQGKRYLHMVFKGFSFEAGGRDYRATGLKLGAMLNQAEHDRFYRIILGDEAMPDVS
jgi:hypothetical protein